ncbi:VOC family protein [Luteimonas salinilitoris]|uniref:VOC family protein n=1 Tax=Luteimonas salinilitoris TaxID=3237697 RepID=A0ABV4HMS9_9GAMM
MIHHVSLGTNDVARAGAFLFSLVTPADGTSANRGNGVHIAFATGSRTQVDTFHRVALDSGAVSDGVPGLRPEYNPNYYGAFVLDPDGNKIEAVTYSAR